MCKKKCYVTLFPECEPVHLKKDVGMLPYSLGKHCNYEFSIVCYQNQEFNIEEKEKFHLKEVRNSGNEIIDFTRYLLVKSRSIDVLNLYHMTSRRNAFWILIYKLLNPKGKVHLKLDADYRMLDCINMTPKSLKGKIRKTIMYKLVDLYSVESVKMYDLLKEKWGIEMCIIPNGVCAEDVKIPAKTNEKGKYFLTVGRLGTEQKATEDLLNAYYQIKDKTDWKLWLVGPMEKTFKDILDDFLKKNSDLRDRILIEGNVSDLKKLTYIYKKSRVFVLPSKWESFAIVLMEALECGDYLIASDQVPSIDDIGRKGKYATTVPYHDIEKLSQAMLAATKKQVCDEHLEEMYCWINNNFSWESIVKKLDESIKALY